MMESEAANVNQVREMREEHGRETVHTPDLKERTVNADAAVFFDLDGTLVPGPSLEMRFFRALHRNGVVLKRNYALWILEAVRLARRGIKMTMPANKLYLRGVAEFCGKEGKSLLTYSSLPSASRLSRSRTIAPLFFSEGVERVAWHARQGHAIVLVSGTLEPLANEAAVALGAWLGMRGITGSIGVYATRLETLDGKWTGQIMGEPMFAEAKARAVERFCLANGIEISRCFAYGNSASDRWMLEAVGRPAAVNPSSGLARIAARMGWPVRRWKEVSTQSSKRTRCLQQKPNERMVCKETPLVREVTKNIGAVLAQPGPRA